MGRASRRGRRAEASAPRAARLGAEGRRSRRPAGAAWREPRCPGLLGGSPAARPGAEVITPAWRAVPGLRLVRARLSVGLFGRSLPRGLGPDPDARAFGPIAGEEERFGPGLEARAAG